MRSGLTWLIYIVCVVLAVDGLAWLTWRTVQAERSRTEAQSRVIHQQRVQLALWRLDSALAWMLRAESGRAPDRYEPFVEVGGHRAASPLLGGAKPPMRLHIAWTPTGGWSSPQVPLGTDRDDAMAMGIEPGKIEVAGRWLAAIAERMPSDPRSGADESLSDARAKEDRAAGRENAGPPQSDFAREAVARDEPSGLSEPSASLEKSIAEAENAGAAYGDQGLRARRQNAVLAQRNDEFQLPETDLFSIDEPIEGELRPIWLSMPGGETAMVLVRDVRIGTERGVVGVWVDWVSLQAALTAEVVDLLPTASLVPIDGGTASATDRLAMIPARVVAPQLATEAEGTMWAGLSAGAWGAIATSWAAVLSAVLAVGVVLWQALALSARRARFASAVSHELRTPLTALRLQADLMPQHEKRAGMLRSQVSRLEAIVESVLAYAGVRRATEARSISVQDALLGVTEQLAEAVERAGGEFDLNMGEVASTQLTCDPTLLHRILVNLIDNSCAHALGSEPLRVGVTAQATGRWIELTVADNGPGISPGERGRIFKPFVGARSGGLGLGLALARESAQAMGGRLALKPGPGAVFVLRLRRA